jgi:hypothetical protein
VRLGSSVGNRHAGITDVELDSAELFCNLQNMQRTTPHNPTPADPILITVPQACRTLSISESTFRRLVSEGLIEVRYVGREGSRNPHRRVVMASLRDSLPQDPPSAA